MLKLKIENVSLNTLGSIENYNVVACVGSRTAILVVKVDSKLIVVHKYVDENKNENFRALTLIEVDDILYIVLGGELGIIKIINVKTGKFCGYIAAHGRTITNLRSFEKYIVSSSADGSIKIWDFDSYKCVSTLSGIHGHNDIVTHFDIHIRNDKLISCGSDLKIIEWKLDLSMTLNFLPLFSSNNLHRNYITCCKYYGNFILTLSRDSRLVLTKPKYMQPSNTFKKKNNRIISNEMRDLKIIEQSTLIPDLLFIKEIKLDDPEILKFEVLEHFLFVLSSTNYIYKVDLRKILKEDTFEKYRLGHTSKAKDFNVLNKFVVILYEDNTITFENY